MTSQIIEILESIPSPMYLTRGEVKNRHSCFGTALTKEQYLQFQRCIWNIPSLGVNLDGFSLQIISTCGTRQPQARY